MRRWAVLRLPTSVVAINIIIVMVPSLQPQAPHLLYSPLEIYPPHRWEGRCKEETSCDKAQISQDVLKGYHIGNAERREGADGF